MNVSILCPTPFVCPTPCMCPTLSVHTYVTLCPTLFVCPTSRVPLLCLAPIVSHSVCVYPTVCIPLRVYSTPCVFHSVYVPLRVPRHVLNGMPNGVLVYSFLYVSHFVPISHSACPASCVSHSMIDISPAMLTNFLLSKSLNIRGVLTS